MAKAAELFVRSVAEGNSEHAKKLFTDDAVLFGILNGSMEHLAEKFRFSSRSSTSLQS